jgi:hypothetical protein
MMNIDKSKARKYELASDLLDKMYNSINYATERQKTKSILSRKHQFDALLLIDRLIEGGHIEGKTNNEVYDMYAFCSEDLGLKTMGKVELSKFLCRYFGFTTVPQRFGDKLKRVYLKKESSKPELEPELKPEPKPKPYSVIGIEQWEAASAEEKMQIVKKVCSGDITVSHYDFEMMLNFVMEQAEN